MRAPRKRTEGQVRISHNSVKLQCPTKVSSKSVSDKCQVTVSHKSVKPERPTKASSQSVLQKCQVP